MMIVFYECKTYWRQYCLLRKLKFALKIESNDFKDQMTTANQPSGSRNSAEILYSSISFDDIKLNEILRQKV